MAKPRVPSGALTAGAGSVVGASCTTVASCAKAGAAVKATAAAATVKSLRIQNLISVYGPGVERAPVYPWPL